MSLTGRPMPEPDPDDEFFWSGLPGRLLVPRCEECGHAWLRPIPACPQCGSTRVQAVERSGRGIVYTWVVVHHALDPAFAADVPYTVVTVELECGARLPGRLLGAEPPSAGLAVQFEPSRRNDVYLPAFRPVTRASEVDSA